jgi:hypothetical protein
MASRNVKKPSLSVTLALSATALLLLAAGGMLAANYALQSHHDIRINSRAYFLLLDDEIAGIPIAKDGRDAYFTSIAQDGTAPAVDAAALATQDFARDSEAIASYVTRLGYAAQAQCAPTCGASWTKGDALIAIHLENERLMVVKTRLASH